MTANGCLEAATLDRLCRRNRRAEDLLVVERGLRVDEVRDSCDPDGTAENHVVGHVVASVLDGDPKDAAVDNLVIMNVAASVGRKQVHADVVFCDHIAP